MEDFEKVKEEKFMELTWDTLDKCNGLGLDCGASVCKIVYIHKDDWSEPKERGQKPARLRCLSFAKMYLDQGLAYLKNNVFIRRKTPEEKPLIWTTGLGGSQFAMKISEVLNIRTINITEIDCFVQSLVFIMKNSRKRDQVDELDKDMTEPLVTKAKGYREMVTQMIAAVDTAKVHTVGSEDDVTIPLGQPFNGEKQFSETGDIFPCYLVMIGSNGCIMRVHEDGRYDLVNDMRLAGKAFVGLGNFFCGTKSYQELMKRAERGNMMNIHEYPGEMAADLAGDEESLYGAIKDSIPTDDELFPGMWFGKGQTKNKADPDDMARSLLFMTAADIIQNVTLPLIHDPKVKHVFFCGGFPTHGLTRKFLVNEMLQREGQNIVQHGAKCYHDIQFLKHGQHLGALGTFLNQMLKFKTEEASIVD